MTAKKKSTAKKKAAKKFVRKPKAPVKKAEELRFLAAYMNAGEIARRFTKPAEKRAITAVLYWLTLNADCAWRMKGRTRPRTATYTINAMRYGQSNVDAVILDWDKLTELERLFGV